MFWTPRLPYLFRYGKQEFTYPLEDEILMGQVEDVAILKDDGHLFVLLQGLNVLQGKLVFVSHAVFIKETFTPSVRIYRAFSSIMLYLICLYIGSATNLHYSFNSSIATTTGRAPTAIDNTPIASVKNPKSISYIYLWILLVVAMLRPFLLLCRSSLDTCLGVGGLI